MPLRRIPHPRFEVERHYEQLRLYETGARSGDGGDGNEIMLGIAALIVAIAAAFFLIKKMETSHPTRS